MKFNLIPDHEKNFETTLTDSSGKRFVVKATEDLGDGTILRKITPATSGTGYFYHEKTPKSMVVIHSTIGVVKGDIATLTNATNPVSVSYLVSRAGVIYELFDPNYWSYHLGKGTIGGNKVNSSRSIGIEMSNMGPLTNVSGGLETVYSRKSYVANGVTKVTGPDVYCTVSDLDAYTKLATPYRGYQFFAKYTDAQYIALNKLIRRLAAEFSIPLSFVDEKTRFGAFTESQATSFHGICSHVNYREGGKWDVGPDFDWSRIMIDFVATQAHAAELVQVPETVELSKPTGLPPFLPTTPIEPPKNPVKSWITSFAKRFQ